MGPYCKFCNRRCFIRVPDTAPAHVQEAYGLLTIAATCPQGKACDREHLGFCADDFAPVARVGVRA